MLLARVNEGEQESFTISYSDFGIDPSLVFDLEAEPRYSGEAVHQTDYSVSTSIGSTSLFGTISGIVDDELEGIETGTINLVGTLTLIRPGNTSTFYENIAGIDVEGSLYTVSVDRDWEIEVNSAPIGNPVDITYIGSGGDTAVINLIDQITDGPGEMITIDSRPITFTGITGRVEASGDVILTSVGNANDGFTFDYTARDGDGAQAELQQFIRVSHLTLTNIGSSLIVVEGKEDPIFTFNLSAPVESDVTITASIAPTGFENDVALFEGNISAGTTSGDLRLLSALSDDVLEGVDVGTLTLIATSGGQDVAINGETELNIALEVWDEVRSAIPPAASEEGFAQASALSDALFAKFNLMLSANELASHADIARNYAGSVASVVGVTIDTATLSAAYAERMQAAEQFSDFNQRVDATYNARRALLVETGDTIAGSVFASSAGAFAGGFVAGLLGVSTVAFLPLVGALATGWAVGILYQEYSDEIKQGLSDRFSEIVPRETYLEFYREDVANPNQALQFHSDPDALFSASTGEELVLLARSDAQVTGDASSLNGDTFVGMGVGGQLQIQNARFDQSDLTVVRGSAILEIDLDDDQMADTVIRLAGDFDDIDFEVSQASGNMTSIALVAANNMPDGVTFTGTPDADVFSGAEGNDTLGGADADDHLSGNAGNDVISGGPGNDTLVGGDGDDTIRATDLVLDPYDDESISFENIAAEVTSEDLVLPGLGSDIIIGTQGTTVDFFPLSTTDYFANTILSYRDLDDIGGLSVRISPSSGYFHGAYEEYFGNAKSNDDRVDDQFTHVRTIEGSQLADLFELEAGVTAKVLVGHAGDDVFTLGSNASSTLSYVREAAFNPISAGIQVNFGTGSITDTYGDVDQFSGEVAVEGTEHDDLFDLREAGRAVEITLGGGDDTVFGGADDFVVTLSEGADQINLGTGNAEIRLADLDQSTDVKKIDLGGIDDDSKVKLRFDKDVGPLSFDGNSGAASVGFDTTSTQFIEFENISHLKAGAGILSVESSIDANQYSFVNMGESRVAVLGDLSNDVINVQGDAPELAIALGIDTAINIDLTTGQLSSLGYADGMDPTITGNAVLTTLVFGADNRTPTDFTSGREDAQITGSEENETLVFVSAGADTLVGGAGEDTLDYSGLTYQNGYDTLHHFSIDLEAGIAQTALQYQFFSYYAGYRGEELFEGFDTSVSTRLLNQQISEFENVIGSDGNDTISGNEDANALIGGEGDDILIGSSVDAVDTAAGQVYRIYQATLNRAPDTGGFTNWVERLETGAMTIQNVVSGFVASNEFSNVYGNLDDTAFVTLLYNNVLDRSPDAAGLNGWETRLSEGASREQVVIGFSQSTEFKMNTQTNASAYATALYERAQSESFDDVFRLYRATLDRSPDQPGLEAWSTRLTTGEEYTSIASGFTNSVEFQNIYGTLDNDGFVYQLYQNVLNRSPDVAGLANWISVITEGGSREDVVRGFAQSHEFILNTQDAFSTYMRSLDGDVLEGGSGNDILAGGNGVDTFVFDAKEIGSDIVLHIDAWDTVEFNGFNYISTTDILAKMTISGPDIYFADRGVEIVFAGADQSTIEAVDYILG